MRLAAHDPIDPVPAAYSSGSQRAGRLWPGVYGRASVLDSLGTSQRLRSSTNRGAIAQLEERLNGIQKVRGSNPLSSTTLPVAPTTYDPLPAGGGSLVISEPTRPT